MTAARTRGAASGSAQWARKRNPARRAIYRFYNGEVTRLYPDITVSNAICFSPDRAYAYYADTPTDTIMRQPLAPDDGWPDGPPAPFIDLSDAPGKPDGAVVDADGNIWNALWGGSGVACYGPDGTFLSSIAMPGSQTTCPAFGGDDLTTLFCTSARAGLPDDAAPVHGQTLRHPDPVQRPAGTPGDPVKRTLGTCYYPEHWPEEIWAEDARRMADAGITWVRIGEFAWSRLEPEPGKLTFDWLDRAIGTLANAGLKIVLGTPTATPPRWMLTKHPDMLAVDADGRPRGFGSRRHYCFSHDGYLAECRRIVTLLAERYGPDPRIEAWQTDNEYGCHDTTLSYSTAALHAFRDWLGQTYQSPDALNRAWGNVFWSMEYGSFDEIGLPNLTVTEPNPAHVLAFRRFSSDMVTRFNRVQADILRAHTDAPLIHNYMGRVLEFDHFDVGADLDIASWDSYPIGFLSDRLEADADHKAAFVRQGDPDMQAFHHDLYRAVGRGRWWVMEQQPGPVNWAPWNPAPLPGMVRLWTWEAFAHGAEVVSYFRWRQAPFAQEQMHAGLLRPDSAPAPALAEAATVARELESLPETDIAPCAVALVFDYASAWAWDTQPQGADFDYFRLVFSTYRALRRAGLSVDILPPDTADLSPYRLVLAPGLATLSDSLLAALAGFGGKAILGPRTNAKTRELAIPVPLPPNLPGLDITVAETSSLPPQIEIPVTGGGSVRHWLEALEGTAETEIETETGALRPRHERHALLPRGLARPGPLGPHRPVRLRRPWPFDRIPSRRPPPPGHGHPPVRLQLRKPPRLVERPRSSSRRGGLVAARRGQLERSGFTVEHV